MDIIEKYPDKPWNWRNTYRLIQILLWSLLRSIQINHGIGIGYRRNPNITMDIIEKHPDKPWNWNCDIA